MADSVTVRVSIYEGSDLTAIRFFAVDAWALAELESFRASGPCEAGVLATLRELAAVVLPAARVTPLEDLAPDLRDSLCGHYVIRRGREIQAAAEFSVQVK